MQMLLQMLGDSWGPDLPGSTEQTLPTPKESICHLLASAWAGRGPQGSPGVGTDPHPAQCWK